MPIEPDNKDWTWVVERPCPECGLDARALARDQIAALVRSNAQSWLAILAEPAELLRRRVGDNRWSPLEYSCHVRDVFRIYQQRLVLMLNEDDPTYPNWDQDRTAVDDRYNDQNPSVVATELAAAAGGLAASFQSVEGPMWDRRGSRSDGARFTVDRFGRYMIHDPIHHLHDVTVDLAWLQRGE
jgi:hypothetical protein